jgi:hypothetical protein
MHNTPNKLGKRQDFLVMIPSVKIPGGKSSVVRFQTTFQARHQLASTLRPTSSKSIVVENAVQDAFPVIELVTAQPRMLPV